MRLASRTLERSAPLRNLWPTRFFLRAPITAETASDDISDSSIIHSSSSIKSVRASLCLITRPPDSTTPPPRSIFIPSSSLVPRPPVGAALTSTSCLPVVVLIMCKSTFEPANLETSFPPLFLSSFALTLRCLVSLLACFAKIFFSFRVNFVGRVYSSSSSHSSHSSVDSGGSSNSSLSSNSSHSSSEEVFSSNSWC